MGNEKAGQPSTRRVLIVDDSLAVRADLAEAFAEEELAVEAVAGLDAARAALRRAPPALVVVDLDLAADGGVRFLEELRLSWTTAAIPALLMSSEREADAAIRGLAAGADAFVQKPYDRAELLRAARGLLARAAPRARAPRVLLIDGRQTDDDLAACLRAEGYALTRADGGRAGLAKARQMWPELIVLPGTLPDLPAPLVVQQLRTDPRLHRTPCVLVGARVTSEVESHALTVGADAFLRTAAELRPWLLARLHSLLRYRPAFVQDLRRRLSTARQLVLVSDAPDAVARVRQALRGVPAGASAKDAPADFSLELRPRFPDPHDLDGETLSALVLLGCDRRAGDWLRALAMSPAADIPVMVLDADDPLAALEAGAADCLALASEGAVLGARLRALLRRRQFEWESRRIDKELSLREMEASRQRAARELAESRAALLKERAARELAESRAELLSELERKNAELTRSNQELSQFAYVASHDLKSPLQGIDLLAAWIEEDLAAAMSEETRAQVQLLRARVARMRNLLDSLLRYSRVGRREERLEVVDVDELLAEVVELVGPPPGMTIEADGELPTLVTFRTPLFQVFTNLLNNAVKHHDLEVGRVVVRADERDEALEFEVLDDGPGIPPEFGERIFRMFQTLRPRDEVETSGMGLALVQKIVDLHGGHVWLVDRPGRGACFRFTWPKEGRP